MTEECELVIKKEVIEDNPARLSKCEVCAVNDAIYTCPKCQVKTCCLSCVNIHKKELECDGIRDRTKFIPIQNFTNTDFYNDYAFLEECSRFVYGKKRNIAKRYTNIDKPLPHYLNRLKRAARERGTVVMFLPEHFVRRRSNSTRVAKLGHIMWRVDFVFGDKLYSHNGMPIPESTRLSKILHDKLEDADSTLDCYKSAGMANIRMLLKAERIKGCTSKFYELDSMLSLKENLTGKCIVEYPTVYVFLKDHSYGLDIVHSDDELDESLKKTDLDEIHEKQSEHLMDARTNGSTCEGENMDISINSETTALNEPEKRKYDDKKRWINRKRSSRGELATVRVAREEREKIQKEIENEAKKKPKNLLFVTGYSSEEDIRSTDDDDGN